jgi:hypothetical protein
VAFRSSPNTATACAMMGTRRVRGSAEVVRCLPYRGDDSLETRARPPPARTGSDTTTAYPWDEYIHTGWYVDDEPTKTRSAIKVLLLVST